MNTSIKLLIAAGAAALLNTHAAMATSYEFLDVTVNTAALKTDSADAPFYVDFQFNNGSTTSNNTNTVTISNFNFGGGSPATGSQGTDVTGGGSITGSLSSSIVISDGESAGINEFYEAFTPGNTLSFDVLIPTVGQPGLTPEDFLFSIQDQSDANIATTDPSGNNELVSATLPIEGSIQTVVVGAFKSTGGAEFPDDTTHPGEAGVSARLPDAGSTCALLGLALAPLMACGRKVRAMRA